MKFLSLTAGTAKGIIPSLKDDPSSMPTCE